MTEISRKQAQLQQRSRVVITVRLPTFMESELQQDGYTQLGSHQYGALESLLIYISRSGG